MNFKKEKYDVWNSGTEGAEKVESLQRTGVSVEFEVKPEQN